MNIVQGLEILAQEKGQQAVEYQHLITVDLSHPVIYVENQSIYPQITVQPYIHNEFPQIINQVPQPIINNEIKVEPVLSEIKYEIINQPHQPIINNHNEITVQNTHPTIINQPNNIINLP